MYLVYGLIKKLLEITVLNSNFDILKYDGDILKTHGVSAFFFQNVSYSRKFGTVTDNMLAVSALFFCFILKFASHETLQKVV